MKHAQATEFQGATIPRHYLMIADFTRASGGAAQLVHKLHTSGVGVVTTAGATPFARLPLIFRTRRLFSQTRVALDAAISPDTHCIIYPSGLGIDQIDKPRWASRRMEEWRRYRLAIAVAWRSKHCTLMLEREVPLWLTGAIALSIIALKPLSLRIEYATPQSVSPNMMETVFTLAGTPKNHHPEYFALRANATKLEKTGKNPALASDLRQVYALSSFLNRTGKALVQTGLSGGISQAKIANHIPAQSGISQFMRHYNATLPKPFPLANARQVQDFTTWYVHGPKVNLPIPQSIAAKEIPLGTSMEQQAKAILTLAHRVENLSFIPTPMRESFAAPLGSDPQNISKLELLCALQAGLKPSNRRMFDAPWQSDEIRRWYSDTICTSAPVMKIFSTGHPHVPDTAKTITVKGITEGQSGLARNAEMHAKALEKLGEPLRSVTLHNINADQIPQQVVSTRSDLHIGFLLWELSKIPESHRLAGKMLDEIWVPSSYVQSIYESAYDRPVVNIYKGIHLPKLGKADMTPYGISERHHVVLTCFDAHSSVERKNPLAAVLAFQQAFEGNHDARMFVKATPTGKSHWGDPNRQMQRITALSKRDPRIIIETEMLPFHDLLALINRADCVVSPHRAEGFGYIPAYALGYATPVIATDYSGTTDICTPETAFPVPHTLREVKKGETIVPVTAVWADIDPNALANAMREVFEYPDLAQRKARAGQKLLNHQYSPAMQAKRYAERLKFLGAI